MERLIRIFLLLISSSVVMSGVQAQPSASKENLLPKEEGGRTSYSAYIQTSKAYISGVCMMYLEQDCLRCSIFNEFGISAIDFIYDIKTKKTKIIHVMKMFDKWYVKRVLKRDLQELLHNMTNGETEYKNVKRGLTYSLTPMLIKKQVDEQDIQNIK